MSDPLKSCPFCNGGAVIEPVDRDNVFWEIHCLKCHVRIVDVDKAKLVAIWNSRPGETAALEGLRKLVDGWVERGWGPSRIRQHLFDEIDKLIEAEQ